MYWGIREQGVMQMFGTKTVEGTGRWRKFRNEEFKSCTSSPHIIIKNKCWKA
jgi:hypothetical protein